MKIILKKIGQTAVTLLLAIFLLYALFEKPARVWDPKPTPNGDVLIDDLKTHVELEGKTIIFDYPVERYNDLKSLVAAADCILIGDFSGEEFVPAETLKGNLCGPFTIHFPDGPQITERVLEDDQYVDLSMTVPSPLSVVPESRVHCPQLVFLRLDENLSFVPVGDPWRADVYADGHLDTRSLLSSTYETAVIATGESEAHTYSKKVIFQGLDRPKADEFLNSLTIDDVRSMIE